MQVPTAVESGLEFVVTATLIVADVGRSVAFYRDVLGADVLRTGQPTFLRLGNLGLTINGGGGPTDDKPDVIATPPKHQNDLSLFLNLRVTDIQRFYERWRSRGGRSSPNQRLTPQSCAATCAIRMAISSRSGKRQSPRSRWNSTSDRRFEPWINLFIAITSR